MRSVKQEVRIDPYEEIYYLLHYDETYKRVQTGIFYGVNYRVINNTSSQCYQVMKEIYGDEDAAA